MTQRLTQTQGQECNIALAVIATHELMENCLKEHIQLKLQAFGVSIGVDPLTIHTEADFPEENAFQTFEITFQFDTPYGTIVRGRVYPDQLGMTMVKITEIPDIDPHKASCIDFLSKKLIYPNTFEMEESTSDTGFKRPSQEEIEKDSRKYDDQI